MCRKRSKVESQDYDAMVDEFLRSLDTKKPRRDAAKGLWTPPTNSPVEEVFRTPTDSPEMNPPSPPTSEFVEDHMELPETAVLPDLGTVLKNFLRTWITSPDGVERDGAWRNLIQIAKDPEVTPEEIARILSLGANVVRRAEELYRQKHKVIWHLFVVFKNKTTYERRKQEYAEELAKNGLPFLETLLAVWKNRTNPVRAGSLAGKVGGILRLLQESVKFHATRAKTTRNAVWRLFYEYRRTH